MRKSLLIFFFIPLLISAQKYPNILFLGNSYTGANDLPSLIANVCNSTGDSINNFASAPGGQRLTDHANPGSPSLAEIEKGTYDIVVLQEQSQIPSFTDLEVENYYYPYVKRLDSSIKAANSCTKTMLYMTWGRKNGDDLNCANWPPVCTYKGMDSLLRLRIFNAADSIYAEVSPVSVAWRYVREHYPHIELYEGDGSHPSQAGSYLAACVFYTSIFKKDPTSIKYNFILDSLLADTLRQACKYSVYEHMEELKIGTNKVEAAFTYTQDSADNFNVKFINHSKNTTSYKWYFGDGDSSTLEHPIHLYNGPGLYHVTLKIESCSEIDSTTVIIHLYNSSIDVVNSKINLPYPNPSKGLILINHQCEIITVKDALGRDIEYSTSIENGLTTITTHEFKGLMFLFYKIGDKQISTTIQVN
ncbi:MAG: PKD domain-containing protein [Bacteroidia bacterium]|nr:PKD domain-containing protein [Bacteroidia bacterium]